MHCKLQHSEDRGKKALRSWGGTALHLPAGGRGAVQTSEGEQATCICEPTLLVLGFMSRLGRLESKQEILDMLVKEFSVSMGGRGAVL